MKRTPPLLHRNEGEQVSAIAGTTGVACGHRRWVGVDRTLKRRPAANWVWSLIQTADREGLANVVLRGMYAAATTVSVTAGRGQSEDDAGADLAAHACAPAQACATHRAQRLHEYLAYEGQLFGSQHVDEYQGEARHGGLCSHRALTYNHSSAIGTHSLRSVHAWAKSELPPGQALRAPAPLFKKLDESVIEEEYARLR